MNLDLLKKLNINKQTPLIVSVSGGVDSVVLLNLLIKNNYTPIVVHFNHHTRDNTLLEQQLVEKISKDNNLKLYVYNFHYKNKENFQNEARNFRHSKLKKVAKLHNTKYILTAHHLDDLAETVLMKITRGSNLYGYAGIHDVLNKDNFIFLKPLLFYPKDEIVKYANLNNINYLTDDSNLDTTYLRNRYRHTILPIMKQENPNLLYQFKDYNNILTNTFNFIRKYSKAFIKDNIINLKTLIKEDQVIINEVIIILLENYNIEFNKNLIKDLTNILLNNRPNLTYTLNNKYIFVKSYNKAYIENKQSNIKFTTTLNKEITKLPNMKKITFLNNVSDKTKNTHKLCYNEIRLPLIARTRLDGDLLQFNFGRKKLKDFLIDKKIPKLKRDKLVIITDSNNTILWVEGIYTNNTLGSLNEIYFEIGDI